MMNHEAALVTETEPLIRETRELRERMERTNVEIEAELARRTDAEATSKVINIGDKVSHIYSDHQDEWMTCSGLPVDARLLLADVQTRAEAIESLTELLVDDECHVSTAKACDGVTYSGLAPNCRYMISTAVTMLMKDLQRDLGRAFDVFGGEQS